MEIILPSEKRNIIFATQFFYLGKWKCKSPTNYLKWFEKTCQTGINLVVFTSGCYYEPTKEIADKYTNVLSVIKMELDELQVSKWIVKQGDIQLPENRNMEKDTIPFLACMNGKWELLAKTFEYGQQGKIPIASNYAWIDFGIFHVLKNETVSSAKLKKIAEYIYPDDFIAYPGCWSIGKGEIDNNINWRFCGGFFLVSSSILLKYHNPIMNYIENYILSRGRITWEVNFFAAVERELNMNFGWYLADHNDTIFNIPIIQN
jgi:hypothetical protein